MSWSHSSIITPGLLWISQANIRNENTSFSFSYSTKVFNQKRMEKMTKILGAQYNKAYRSWSVESHPGNRHAAPYIGIKRAMATVQQQS